MGLQQDAEGGDFGPAGPSFKENGLNDGVKGTILHAGEMTATEYNTDKPLRDRNGNEVKQYVVTLQTELRDWQKVAKVPTDDDKRPLPPSEDTGIRKVYAKYGNKTRMAKAIVDAAPDLNEIGDSVGMTLMVKLAELVPTNKGNDRKDYAYKAEGTPKGNGGLAADAAGAEDPGEAIPEPPVDNSAAATTPDNPPF